MSSDKPISEQLRENAELVLATARDDLEQDIGYNEAGVRWLDGYVQRMREHPDAEMKAALVSTLGAFLGQCLIETYGGMWVQHDGWWGVQFSAGNIAFPLSKVAKQLDNGAEDSVLSFFMVIRQVLQRPS